MDIPNSEQKLTGWAKVVGLSERGTQQWLGVLIETAGQWKKPQGWGQNLRERSGRALDWTREQATPASPASCCRANTASPGQILCSCRRHRTWRRTAHLQRREKCKRNGEKIPVVDLGAAAATRHELMCVLAYRAEGSSRCPGACWVFRIAGLHRRWRKKKMYKKPSDYLKQQTKALSVWLFKDWRDHIIIS